MEITKGQLQLALAQWELDARLGRTLTREEAASQSLTENSADATDYLWGLLAQLVHGPDTKAPAAAEVTA